MHFRLLLEVKSPLPFWCILEDSKLIESSTVTAHITVAVTVPGFLFECGMLLHGG